MKEKIYENYSSSFGKNKNLRFNELKKREPYLKYLIKQYFANDKNSSVLDIACGYGALSLFSQKNGYNNIIGIDLSKEEIEIGREMGIKNLIHGDVFEYLLNSKNKFDLIVCQDFIEHLNHEQLTSIFSLIKDSLKDKGFILLHTINSDSPFFGKVLYGDITHERAFNRASISQILNLYNFKIIKITEEKIVIHGIKSMLRNILWKLIRLIYSFFNIIETGSSQGIYTQNFLIYAKKN